jgi:hypothetical protein
MTGNQPLPQTDSSTTDKNNVRCFILGAVFHLLGSIAFCSLVILEQFGFWLPDPLGLPIYFSYVLPIVPAVLFLCGLAILAVHQFHDALDRRDAQHGPATRARHARPLAVVAFVQSCLSIICHFWPASIGGIICSHIVLRQSRTQPNLTDATVARGALVIGYLSIAARVLVLIVLEWSAPEVVFSH